VWPIHITPGVNRGYQPGRLRDYVLVDHTAVCGPHVHRGDLLPGCDGDAFVCEPAGNLVRRIRLSDQDGRMRGENVYQPQQQEFLASTDERFRPVNLFGGPDGAVYLLDMYRGVIQHKNFVTSYLSRQILGRKLEQPIGLGAVRHRVLPHHRAHVARIAAIDGAGNDLTRRDVQAAAKAARRPWDMSKGFDHSAVVGALRQGSAVPQGRIRCRVDGVVTQDADLAEMIWPVAGIIAHLSQLVELKAGDLIFTGTPAGVGPIGRGQLCEVQIDGLAPASVRVG